MKVIPKTLRVLYLHLYSLISFSLLISYQICGYLREFIQQSLYNLDFLKEMCLEINY
jgi:hypothetical protein